MRRRLLGGLALALIAAACGTSDVADSDVDAPNSPTAVQTTAPVADSTTVPANTVPPPTTSPAPTTSPTIATTTSTTTTEVPVSPSDPRPDCRRIDGFDDDLGRWFIVNDGVMGGRSDGRLAIEDSVLRFSGTVVTAGGGFTSVRLRLDDDELAGSTRIELRLRADDRVYGLTYEDAAEIQGRSVSHRADLVIDGPADGDGYRTVTLAHAELRPSIFGRSVDAPPFDPGTAREIGIIIADGRDGDFSLEVDWIDACS